MNHRVMRSSEDLPEMEFWTLAHEGQVNFVVYRRRQ